MKLIDLLVQELPKRGGWPEYAADVHALLDFVGGYDIYFMAESYGTKFYRRSSEESVTREQSEAALAASKQPVWNGEGLPPVGVECEFFNDDRFDCRPSVPDDGTKVKIVAHEKSKIGIDVAVFTWFGADNSLHAESCTELLFRPIRTEAERKREEAGLAIYHAINWNADGELVSPSRMEDYRKAYDAIAAGKIPGVKLAD